MEGYKSVPCPFCAHLGPSGYKKSISSKDFSQFLSWVIRKRYHSSQQEPNFFEMSVPYRGRVLVLRKALLRRYLGRKKVPSNHFELGFVGEKKVFWKGEGLGHGVGMCQIGALALARQGLGYKKILAHYFPLFKIHRLYL